jgi:hypothetical protein
MSRIIDILSAIRNGETYDSIAMSRAEAILKSIANGTAYTDAPMSRFEELLLAIKNGETVSGTPQSRIEEILFAIANGTLDEYLNRKNLFDISRIASRADIKNNGDGTLIVASGVYFVNTQKTLRELCPTIKVGDTCTLQMNTDSEIAQYIYLDKTWGVGQSLTITEQHLNANVAFYGFHADDKNLGEECTIRDIKIELGTTATPYTAYAFESELEEAFIATADKLKGE